MTTAGLTHHTQGLLEALLLPTAGRLEADPPRPAWPRHKQDGPDPCRASTPIEPKAAEG